MGAVDELGQVSEEELQELVEEADKQLLEEATMFHCPILAVFSAQVLNPVCPIYDFFYLSLSRTDHSQFKKAARPARDSSQQPQVVNENMLRSPVRSRRSWSASIGRVRSKRIEWDSAARRNSPSSGEELENQEQQWILVGLLVEPLFVEPAVAARVTGGVDLDFLLKGFQFFFVEKGQAASHLFFD